MFLFNVSGSWHIHLEVDAFFNKELDSTSNKNNCILGFDEPCTAQDNFDNNTSKKFQTTHCLSGGHEGVTGQADYIHLR